ncbi:hypothetical protein HGM15179_017572, partial [Zosterops borbonicus]
FTDQCIRRLPARRRGGNCVSGRFCCILENKQTARARAEELCKHQPSTPASPAAWQLPQRPRIVLGCSFPLLSPRGKRFPGN